jgi:2'-hydroxyisoflavone reductase
MRFLVLGGTAFVGRGVVEAALARGWQVTTFNRGQTGQDVPGNEAVRGDRYDSRAVAALARRGPWDAAVDCSGYVPRNVLGVAGALAPQIGRYVFVSTVSAYADWPSEPLSEASALLPCPPDAGPDYGTDTEDGPTRYGYQKSGSEAAALQALGAGRVVILRPGVILGPREYVGRLPWWLRRVAADGKVIAPGTPDRAIQPIDARDVADFAVSAAR